MSNAPITDIDLFLDQHTGKHLWPPRIRDRSGTAWRAQAGELPIEDFPTLVRVLYRHYLHNLTGDSRSGDNLALEVVDSSVGDIVPFAKSGCFSPACPPAYSDADGDATGASPPNNAPSFSSPAGTNVTPRLDWGLLWRNIPLRVTYQPTSRGLHIAISRGLWPVPTLEALGHDSAFAARLRHAMKTPGLILVLGDQGAGKTTTMWSAIIDHVSTQNTKAVVLEDVTEIPAEGPYGDAGMLIQVPVPNRDFGSFLPHVMRLRSQHVVINEIRDQATAKEVLLSATRVSIITTGHGHDIEQALNAFRDLAAGDNGTAWAATALANSLVAAVHLRGIERRADGGFRVKVEALFMDGEERDALRGLIRHNQMQGLREHIRRQTATGWKIPKQPVVAVGTGARRPVPVSVPGSS